MIRILVAIIVIAAAVPSFFFRVDERELAIKFRFGEILGSDYEPGLHPMIPIFNDVQKFDARLQTLDAEPQRYLTVEKKDVIVDAFVRWRIVDVERFYRSTRGDVRRAGLLLYQQINDGLRSEFGKRTIREVVSGERADIMDIVTRNANEKGQELGMAVIDVRLKRIDLPEEVSSTVYNRMRSERARVARELRARGDKEAIRITADADRQRSVVIAEAYRDAETSRGEGDAGASRIYAEAYEQNPSFYAFQRSLEAYSKSFRDKGDLLLIEPDSEFFRFFKDPVGRVTP